MKEELSNAAAGNGFRISNQPLWGTPPAPAPREGRDVTDDIFSDLFYVIARDPQSLFLYWDLNWTRLFAQAGLSPRQVHLRIYRGDGLIEGTQEINPFRGHCYAEVAGAGTAYYCELGSFENAEWTSLVRSPTAATPEASMSDDLSGEFATLPIHLSFQRLLDIFGEGPIDPALLTQSVAELQENARLLQSKLAPGDWPQVATKIAARLNGANGKNAPNEPAGELAELVELALRRDEPAAPSAEELARWKELGERYGSSSGSGASKGGCGSSPA